jgi:hypothetical protein
VARIEFQGLLAIPQSCLWNVDRVVVEAVLVNEHVGESMLLNEAADFGYSQVPIEVEIADHRVGEVAETQAVEKRKVTKDKRE